MNYGPMPALLEVACIFDHSISKTARDGKLKRCIAHFSTFSEIALLGLVNYLREETCKSIFSEEDFELAKTLVRKIAMSHPTIKAHESYVNLQSSIQTRKDNTAELRSFIQSVNDVLNPRTPDREKRQTATLLGRELNDSSPEEAELVLKHILHQAGKIQHGDTLHIEAIIRHSESPTKARVAEMLTTKACHTPFYGIAIIKADERTRSFDSVSSASSASSASSVLHERAAALSLSELGADF